MDIPVIMSPLESLANLLNHTHPDAALVLAALHKQATSDLVVAVAVEEPGPGPTDLSTAHRRAVEAVEALRDCTDDPTVREFAATCLELLVDHAPQSLKTAMPADVLVDAVGSGFRGASL